MAVAPHAHHDHTHSHDHHGHDHAHEPAAAPRRPARAVVSLSLLRLSALERGAGALALVALLWLGVWWALT